MEQSRFWLGAATLWALTSLGYMVLKALPLESALGQGLGSVMGSFALGGILVYSPQFLLKNFDHYKARFRLLVGAAVLIALMFLALGLEPPA